MDLATLWPLFDEEDEDYDEYEDGAAAIAGGPPATVTFPTTPLNFRVQIALTPDFSHGRWWEWGWADITTYVRWDPGIGFTTGRPDEASSVDAGTGGMKLDNTDGRFSRRNPYGAYYPYLTKNTPIWVQADAGTGYVTLLQHFVNEWPSRWDQSRNDATVPIATAGILRRLAQGRVLKSAVRRAITFSDPVAYWPLEDGSGATSGASAISGGKPMGAINVEFGSITSLAGSDVTPDLATGSGRLAVSSPGGLATVWGVGFAAIEEGPEDSLLEMNVDSATHANWKLFVPILGDANYYLVIRTPAGATTASLSFAGTVNANTTWHHYGITAEQSGSNIIVNLYIDGVLAASNTSAGTLGLISNITLNPRETPQISSVAHVEIQDSATLSDAANALDGYTGETAKERVARICREENIPFTP